MSEQAETREESVQEEEESPSSGLLHAREKLWQANRMLGYDTRKAITYTEEEPDHRYQHMGQKYFLRNEKIRLAIICCSLFAIVFALVLFFLTHSVFPLFLAIVVTFFSYKHLDASFRKREIPFGIPSEVYLREHMRSSQQR
jgi:hypothetical protein